MAEHQILTQQGYILSKSQLNNKWNEKKIKRALTVKPIAHPDFKEGNESFEIFTQDTNTITVPRYWGIQNLGTPKENCLSGAPQIDINFKHNLRPIQQPVAEECLNRIRSDGGGIISLHCGFGKCLAKGTHVMMFDGSTKMVENIQVGDLIMGDDSLPRTILSLARGKEEMFDIIPSDGGEKYTVNKSHILSLRYDGKRSALYGGIENGDILDIEVSDYLNLLKTNQNFGKHLKGFRTKVEFPHKDVDFDPYTFGLIIGSNNAVGNISSNIDNRVSDEYNKFTHFKSKLTDYNESYIPQIYKCNSRENQLQLLAGIIDYCGKLNQHTFDTCIKSESICDDIIFMVRSLGLGAYKKLYNDLYKITIYGAIHIIPTRIKHKQVMKKEETIDITSYDIIVKSIGIDNYYGFEIDGNRRFLLRDFTVTHNTVVAIWLACQLKKKTLVIGHKSFLLNQWIERIKQFTNAKIGIIRQNQIDIEGKDIVIGMLQSISMKDYDPEIFKQFGTIIIDECHHCPSRVFSRALKKCGAEYTIGLSATPKRNDGLMKVAKWYLGDIIYELERKEDLGVETRLFRYTSTNDKFVEKCMFRGGRRRPHMQKMINNLCEIPERNKFISNIIDTICENYDRKIIVLSGRIAHLEALKKLVDKKINSKVEEGELMEDEIKTDFYIGRMKRYELDEAANANIIFASYAMAEEGLDIDSLNTLILATPKKNVVQSVGRIMRKPAGDGSCPLIIDIIDELSIFEKWGNERANYYGKKNYNMKSYHAIDDKVRSINDMLRHQGEIITDIPKEPVMDCSHLGLTNECMELYRRWIIHTCSLFEYRSIIGFLDEEEDEILNEIKHINYSPNLNEILDV